MFSFVVRYLRPLRLVPGLPHLFDSLLLALSAVSRPQVAGALDEIARTLFAWPGVTQGLHRFGGVEYRVEGREIGHVHGNGVLDIPLTKPLRQRLVSEGRADPHHIYPQSGWITFYIRTQDDLLPALSLLRLSYERLCPECDAKTDLAAPFKGARNVFTAAVSASEPRTRIGSETR